MPYSYIFMSWCYVSSLLAIGKPIKKNEWVVAASLQNGNCKTKPDR